MKLHELDYEGYKLYKDSHGRFWRRAKHGGYDMFEVKLEPSAPSCISLRLTYDQRELAELELEEVEGC